MGAVNLNVSINPENDEVVVDFDASEISLKLLVTIFAQCVTGTINQGSDNTEDIAHATLEATSEFISVLVENVKELTGLNMH